MWPNPQETADLVTFIEKSLIENFIFGAVFQIWECAFKRCILKK